MATKHQKCIICENTYICRNVQEFEKTFRSIYLGFAEHVPLLITKEIKEAMENALLKIKKSKKNGNIKYAQFSVLTKKWLSPALNTLLTKPSLQSEQEKSYKTVKFNDKELGLLTITTIFPQVLTFTKGNFMELFYGGTWIFFNFLLAYVVTNIFRRITNQFVKNQNAERILRFSSQFTFTWSNCLFCYFVFGPNFHENYALLLWNFFFIPSILWLSPTSWVSKRLDNIYMNENLYEFY